MRVEDTALFTLVFQKASKLLALLTFIGLLVLSPIVSAAFQVDPEPEDPNCKDVLVVFARGSGQNGDGNTNDNIYTHADNATQTMYHAAGLDGTEKQTATFVDNFSQSIGTVASVQYMSLHDFPGKYNNYGYAAVGAENAFFDKHKPNHRKDVSNRYYESVKDGAEELAWYLEDQMTSCPLQHVVLGGYSQGAEVVADGVNIMQPAFRNRIAYMAMYGDPKFNPAQSIVPPKSGWWKRGNTDVFTHGILNQRRNYIPDDVLFASSWCQAGDLICDAGQLNSNEVGNYLYGKVSQSNAHSNAYQDKWIQKSMSEIVHAVRNVVPNANYGVGTGVFINKNDKLWDLDLAVVIDKSSSMQDALQTIKGNVGGLTGELLSSYWNSRVGIVTYDGTPPGYQDPTHQYSSVVTPFTDNHTEVTSGLQSITADSPYYGLMPDGHSLYMLSEQSAQYSGIMTAIHDLQWEHGAQKKIIVITDNTAQAPDPSPDHWTADQVKQAAFNLDPAVLNLANVSCDDTWDCDYSVNNDFQQLADSSGGQVSSVNLSFGTIDDLSALLDQMAMQPVASFTGDQNGYVNYPLSFNADESYDPNSAITEYAWDCTSDGIWDDVTGPNDTCTYDQPGDYLVTMRVWSSDDEQGSLATLPVHVVAGSPPATPAAPEKPDVSLNYGDGGMQLTWSNTYGSDAYIKIDDDQDNLLGYAPASAQGIALSGIGSDVPELHISACTNAGGCSDPSVVSLDHNKLDAMVVPDDVDTFMAYGIPAETPDSTAPEVVSPQAEPAPSQPAGSAPQAAEPAQLADFITPAASVLGSSTPASVAKLFSASGISADHWTKSGDSHAKTAAFSWQLLGLIVFGAGLLALLFIRGLMRRLAAR